MSSNTLGRAATSDSMIGRQGTFNKRIKPQSIKHQQRSDHRGISPIPTPQADKPREQIAMDESFFHSSFFA